MKLKGQRKTMKHCAFCGICIDICLNSVKKNYSNTGMPITPVLVISNAVLHFDIYWWIFTRMCTLDIILIMNKKISGDWHVSNCAIKIISHHCWLKTLTIANIISSCKIIGFTPWNSAMIVERFCHPFPRPGFAVIILVRQLSLVRQSRVTYTTRLSGGL